MLGRALVIDDDDVARELMVSILQDGGYDTFDLPSPIGATQLLMREDIKVLVVDVMMPELRGDKLATLLRSNRRLKDLVIVLVSGCPPEELQTMAATVDASGVVDKREVRHRLLDVIARGTRSMRSIKPRTT